MEFRNFLVATTLITLVIYAVSKYNKCIGDDTKAAGRQSITCIKNKNK